MCWTHHLQCYLSRRQVSYKYAVRLPRHFGMWLLGASEQQVPHKLLLSGLVTLYIVGMLTYGLAALNGMGRMCIGHTAVWFSHRCGFASW